MNECLELKTISQFGLSRLVNTSFLKYKKMQDRENFAYYGECNILKPLDASLTKGLHADALWDLKLNEHIVAQCVHWELYYASKNLSISEPEKVLIIIHDEMNHSKTASSHFFHKNKKTMSFMKLPISIICMITHRHGGI